MPAGSGQAQRREVARAMPAGPAVWLCAARRLDRGVDGVHRGSDVAVRVKFGFECPASSATVDSGSLHSSRATVQNV